MTLNLFVNGCFPTARLCRPLQSHGSVASVDPKAAVKRGQKPRKKPGGKSGKEASKKVHGAAGETPSSVILSDPAEVSSRNFA